MTNDTLKCTNEGERERERGGGEGDREQLEPLK